jgi:hypothetical protein
VTKILVKKIVSLYPIFFSKIVYLYRFKRYIFEYRCPTLHVGQLFVVNTMDVKDVFLHDLFKDGEDSMSFSLFLGPGGPLIMPFHF